MKKSSGILMFAALVAVASAQSLNQDSTAGLLWRNVGPFRGGRVAAVTGAVGQPGVFYIGLPLGGVWKTTSAGQTWYPIFDQVKEVSAIGSVQVAPSNPNTIYAGTGDMLFDGGNGVYKSTDAGQSWTNIGLKDTKQIPMILVDPKDENLVLAAAQGNQREEMEDRGVFRSTDGGQTWKKTLYMDNKTGCQSIGWANDHPNVVLATMGQHFFAPPPERPAPRPGAAATPRTGGGGNEAEMADQDESGQFFRGGTPTHLFKSTDQGQTWTELKGNGLPEITGRATVAVAMNTNAQRMFIIGTFGLYRSDDGGEHWEKMAKDDRRIANGQGNYTSGVFVDPQNPDVVYTLATSSYVSRDGGKTFTGFKGAPGGDDPQVLWIDPTNGQRMLLAGDQGASVSLDGGLDWGLWYNQPTAQVYHISVDNQYPYWIYATQQDSGSIATRTRGNLGEITPLDWLPHPGYEFGYIVADPLNPSVSYAGGPAGGIIKTTYPSGQWINVSPSMDSTEQLRRTNQQPMAFCATNPHELLLGFQYLMSSTDGGMHWHKLGPDLTLKNGEKPAPPPAPGAGPPRRFGFGGAFISGFSTSSVAPGVIWVTTSNGLIKVTKDHGHTWDDVNISGLAPRSDLVYIDSSHTDPAAAYVAISRQQAGDLAPYYYRTRDYGKTWTKIVTGLPTDQPSESFARCIKADTERDGLLFAGTESGMYVSFNDGDNWQPLMFNLPNTSYRDIAIHDNDLVVGTYGRSFWVLDDYSPLRQMSASTLSEPAHLFKPGDAIRVHRDVNGDTPFPPEVPHALNPPEGALIYYSLGQKPQGDIMLEIVDSSGRVVRHLSSAPIPPVNEPEPPVPDFWKRIPKPMPAEVGLNRINWDLRYDEPPVFSHDISQVMGAVPHDTPWNPEGPLALPGTYTAKLTVDGKTYTQTFTVRNDPRSPATFADLRAQHDLAMKLYDAIQDAHAGYEQVAAMRAEVSDIQHSNPSAEISKAADDFDAKLSAVGGSAGGRGRFGGFGGFGGGGAGPTFVAVHGNLVRQMDTLDYGDMAPSEPMIRAYGAAISDLKKVSANWAALNSKDLVAFNAVLSKNSVKPIASATSTATAAGTRQ